MSAGFLRCFAFAVVLVVLLAPRQARADDPTDLPPVEVKGTAITTEGLLLACFTDTCNDLIPLSTEIVSGEMSEITNVGSGAVDKEKFCKNLAGNQPPGCTASSPPSVPGFDPSWVGNGCGDGSFALIFADSVVGHVIPGYTGDLDHPLPGISFYAACQHHDMCYGSMGSDKTVCDSDFKAALSNTCSSSSNYGFSCGVLTSLYYYAVRYLGSSNFNAAQGEMACAAWALEMEVNQCKQNA